MSTTISNGDGPCGACKFLRRKCVKGCIFAPYFDQEQGTAHFAAVHRVFGASNASKLLLRLPPHRRLDAVVTLCYEALARVRDPVYGSVGHIFTLQQKVVNLQAEIAYIQARLAMLQRAPMPSALPPTTTFDLQPCSDLVNNSTSAKTLCDVSLHLDETSTELVSFCNPFDQETIEDGDLHSVAREYVSRYFPGVKFSPPASM